MNFYKYALGLFYDEKKNYLIKDKLHNINIVKDEYGQLLIGLNQNNNLVSCFIQQQQENELIKTCININENIVQYEKNEKFLIVMTNKSFYLTKIDKQLQESFSLMKKRPIKETQSQTFNIFNYDGKHNFYFHFLGKKYISKYDANKKKAEKVFLQSENLQILKVFEQNTLIYTNDQGFYLRDIRQFKGDQFIQFKEINHLEIISENKVCVNSKEFIKIYDIRKIDKSFCKIQYQDRNLMKCLHYDEKNFCLIDSNKFATLIDFKTKEIKNLFKSKYKIEDATYSENFQISSHIGENSFINVFEFNN